MHKQIWTTAQNFASANSEDSGESAHKHSLARKIATRQHKVWVLTSIKISSTSSYNYVPEHVLHLNSHAWPILLLQKHPGNVFSQTPAPGPPVVCC